MGRKNEFLGSTKRQAIQRQQGKCAFCGVLLNTPWTEGDYRGYAHHLRPIRHGGSAELDNCVYLCWGHHLLLGHGMSPKKLAKSLGVRMKAVKGRARALKKLTKDKVARLELKLDVLHRRFQEAKSPKRRRGSPRRCQRFRAKSTR